MKEKEEKIMSTSEKFQEDCKLIYDYYKRKQDFDDYVASIIRLCEMEELQSKEVMQKTL